VNLHGSHWFTRCDVFFMSFRPRDLFVAEICVGTPERCQEGLAGSLSLPRFGPVEWSLVPLVPCCGDKFYQGKWDFHGENGPRIRWQHKAASALVLIQCRHHGDLRSNWKYLVDLIDQLRIAEFN
jgi:hypothetical protein